MRLDHLVSQKYGLTRNKAQQVIKNGLISLYGIISTKTALEVKENDLLVLKEDKSIAWVSRSAGKLDGFFESLIRANIGIDIQGKICLDIGSSTGGFTQVLLERGASHIDAVDVGSYQLHESLKNHPKISSYEQTDIRNFIATDAYDIIVCDASFISLREIFTSILKLASDVTHIILLWKPQFEVGREHLRRTGVPKDDKIVSIRQKEWEDFILNHNCEILQKEKSSVIGEAGNQEWVYWIKKV